MSKTYKVKKGDTLWAIAQAHKVELSQLVRINKISNSNLIYPGQLLIIPAEANKAPAGKDYEAIVKQAEAVVEDVEALPSFRRLLGML